MNICADVGHDYQNMLVGTWECDCCDKKEDVYEMVRLKRP